MTEHQNQPWECPICAPIIEAARAAREESTRAFSFGNFKGYNDPAYLAAGKATREAQAAYEQTRREHLAAERAHEREQRASEPTLKKLGGWTVDDSQEFTLADLRKIGPSYNEDHHPVFVDYDGTNKGWYARPITEIIYDRAKGRSVNAPARTIPEWTRQETKTRRSVLKAMVTRRDNKRKLAALKAHGSSQ